MAGAGKKTFTAGEVLTASDVNTYLMEQSVMVFGGTAARSSAIPTPSEGMTSYRTDTQQIESYDGAEWRGMSGLQLVKKQDIGTGVSSIVVSNAFSATYENYKILITGGVGSATGDFTWILTGITSGYYNNLINQTWGAGTVSGVGQSNVSNGLWIGGYATNAMYAEMDIQSPFLNKITTVQSRNFGLAVATSVGISSCFINNTTSATGITFSTAGGTTVTGGTIYVYGYGR